MKKTIYLSLILGLSVIQKSNAQNPVGFPTGIAVGYNVNTTTTVTLPAGYKMAVAGGIITEKMRVATTSTINWADYVFEPSYKLRPLSVVAEYIKINKHLPDVPSASDVNKEGFELVQNQILLLQKVEELTLYAIKQNKEIEQLKKQMLRIAKK